MVPSVFFVIVVGYYDKRRCLVTADAVSGLGFFFSPVIFCSFSACVPEAFAPSTLLLDGPIFFFINLYPDGADIVQWVSRRCLH